MINLEKDIMKIKSGEVSKDELYREIKPFLDYLEKKYKGYLSGGGFEYGDIKTLVWLGVERAIETYSGEKNCKFLTWVAVCVKYIFMEEHRKSRKREVPLEAISEDGDDLSMEEMIPDVSAMDSFDEAETKMDGRKAVLALKNLSEEERRVVILLHIKDIQ